MRAVTLTKLPEVLTSSSQQEKYGCCDTLNDF